MKLYPFYIAHRGLFEGPDPKEENKPEQIQKALDENFMAEADVWAKDEVFYLGHDAPTYKIDIDFLKNWKIICHAKNKEALFAFYKHSAVLHYFWHEEDDYTLTSNGYIWAYPGKPHDHNCIVHLVDMDAFRAIDFVKNPATGMLSKYIKNIRDEYIKLL
jgi:hypothetical protein